ncbi:MAG: hypothetical protein ABSA79_01060 [Candidatus Bathyarchaeia archaeon]
MVKNLTSTEDKERFKRIEEIKGKQGKLFVELPEELVQYFQFEKDTSLYFIIKGENSFLVKIQEEPTFRPT